MAVAGVDVDPKTAHLDDPADATPQGIQRVVDVANAATTGNCMGPLIAAVTLVSTSRLSSSTNGVITLSPRYPCSTGHPSPQPSSSYPRSQPSSQHPPAHSTPPPNQPHCCSTNPSPSSTPKSRSLSSSPRQSKVVSALPPSTPVPSASPTRTRPASKPWRSLSAVFTLWMRERRRCLCRDICVSHISCTGSALGSSSGEPESSIIISSGPVFRQRCPNFPTSALAPDVPRAR